MAKARPRTSSQPAPPVDDQWRIPDVLWERIVPLLPPRPHHPLGCHNPRVNDRKAMDGIFFVLRTGCQWGALDYPPQHADNFTVMPRAREASLGSGLSQAANA